MHIRTVDFHGALVDMPDPGPQFPQDGEQHLHITDLGQVFQPADAVHHQCGGDDGHGRVFCAADRHFTVQGRAALNQIFFQNFTNSFIQFYRKSARFRTGNSSRKGSLPNSMGTNDSIYHGYQEKSIISRQVYIL